MDELDRDVLGIRTVRSLAERQQPSTTQEAVGHLTASQGQPARLAGKEPLEDLIPFQEVFFRPRAAVFHRERELTTTVLGHELSMPVIISSVGSLAIGHRDGDAGVARAAGAAGTIQFVSGVTWTPIEEIIATASGPIF